eukprot:948402-Rhodomonas_salina.1
MENDTLGMKLPYPGRCLEFKNTQLRTAHASLPFGEAKSAVHEYAIFWWQFCGFEFRNCVLPEAKNACRKARECVPPVPVPGYPGTLVLEYTEVPGYPRFLRTGQNAAVSTHTCSGTMYSNTSGTRVPG